MKTKLKNNNSSPEIKTFGCRLNSWESQVIGDHASKHGHSDLVIFNTCAVTSEAERKARQAIRSVKRNRPVANILVTGCAAQIDPEKWAKSSSQKRWYVLYHELGHDVLNLEHGQGGKMMFNFVDRNYTWDEFFNDKQYMFNFLNK